MLNMTLSDQIRKLAARPQGVCSNDPTGCTVQQASIQAYKLAKRGEIFGVKLSHRMVRHFATKAAADAFDAHIQRDRAKTHAFRDTFGEDARGAPWPADAPAIVPPHVKVQRCPSFAPRFQEHVMPFVHGGLRRA